MKFRFQRVFVACLVIGVTWLWVPFVGAGDGTGNPAVDLFSHTDGLRLFTRPTLGDHLSVWQITDDPAIRDHANHHSVNCWSPDGRYICYTHWGGDRQAGKQPGGKSTASIHIYDFHRRQDSEIDRGIDPRWAKAHNWLFYTRYQPKRGPLCGEGTELMWLKADGDGPRPLASGVERLGGTDYDDRWIYGERRSCKAPWTYTTVRVRIDTKSRAEILPAVRGASPLPNPRYPVLYTRDDHKNEPFEATRLWYRLDGSREHILVPMVQKSHASWLGSGEYLLMGDGLIRGRRWNEPYPSNLDVLAGGRVGDISACGRSGRFVCGDSVVADLRPGDTWIYMRPLSMIVLPKGIGDYSQLYDADPKGSPDGTKICFVSNYPLADGPITRVIGVRHEDTEALEVGSTRGFPDSGSLILQKEVIGYRGKTDTRFLNISRGLYNSPIAGAASGRFVKSFEAGCLSQEQLKTSPRPSRTMKRLMGDSDSPLIHQRQTDVYVAVVRRPDPPVLQMADGLVQLIPGESHYETYGYHLFCNGKRVTSSPIRPGQKVALSAPGDYRATAVEWSGLQSDLSSPVSVAGQMSLRVLEKEPPGFLWTEARWRIDGVVVSGDAAKKAPLAVKEVHHLYDGLIHRERYKKGVLSEKEDYNVQGSVTRKTTYTDGRISKREYFNRNGQQVSLEIFDADGSVTASAYYRYRKNNRAFAYDRWVYRKGVPIRRIVKERVVYEKHGEQWQTSRGRITY